MKQFRSVFGTYPKVITAWMMDTDSINYARETYGVEAHQITREQWGTDSYTMSGGPIHYPYLASKSWAFVPASSSVQNPDNSTLILRQTVSDPLRNYGDSSSAFTSQPNDYARDGKDFSFFQKLVGQMLDQTNNPYSILILGLENSMNPQFQKEYIKQIEHIKSLQKERSDKLKVQTVLDFNQEFREKWAHDNTSIVVGSDIINHTDTQAIWVTTSSYRVRILYKDNKMILNDFRVYSDQLSDPYNFTVAQNLGYWVTPFLLDSSRFYLTSTEDLPIQQRIKNRIKQAVLPEFQTRETLFPDSINDTFSAETGIIFPDVQDKSFDITRDNNLKHVVLKYSTTDDNIIQIVFEDSKFSIKGISQLKDVEFKLATDFLPTETIIEKGSGQLIWSAEVPSYALNINCEKNNECIFSPTIDQAFDQQQFWKTQYPYLFPEIKERELSAEKTTFYAHNPYSIAGKNPVRFVLIPRDEQGFSISTNKEISLTSQPSVDAFYIQDAHGNTGTTFIDFAQSNTGKFEVEMKLGDQIQKHTIVYFAPNCKVNFSYCLIHPRQSLWYLKSMFYTKLREM